MIVKIINDISLLLLMISDLLAQQSTAAVPHRKSHTNYTKQVSACNQRT